MYVKTRNKQNGRKRRGGDKNTAPEDKDQRTRQTRPNQTPQRTEGSRAGGRPRETALTTPLLHFLENGGDWRMGPPQENRWAAGPGGHRYYLGQCSGLAGYGAQASGLLITLVYWREMCTWQLLRLKGLVLTSVSFLHTMFAAMGQV